MLKSELRKKYLQERKQFSDEKVNALSNKIKKLFLDEFELNEVDCLHVFLPIPKFREVNTWQIIEYVWKHFPDLKTATSIVEEEELVHVAFDQQTKLEVDSWGIPIPVSEHIVEVEEPNIVLVPLLTFDKDLNRVGYGKGFYDRFLAGCSPDTTKIGLSLFTNPEVIDDINESDVALDYIITPEKII